ncbi:MAG: TatD family hydrolase [Candidatus Kaiserbacteria bacterium]|nr:MAG: TatD family hydrolase [Candidatus Kaiserbacteria bacterium]
MFKYFDAHTHTNFAAYESDRQEVIARAKAAGVGMNVVGTQYDTSAAAVALAEQYDNVYATIGLHPIHTAKSYHDEKELGEGGKAFTSRGEHFDASKYAELGKHKKVIAVGECGLDYYRCDESSKELQKEVFIEHIELANVLGKALMLHIRPSDGRDAYEDALEILKAHSKVKGDTHFFAGNWEVGKKFVDFGFTLSFTGVLTFTHDYDEVVRSAPLDMLLSETDAPYVTPVPHRGKRNEPSYVAEVVRAIARIRAEDEEKVAIQLVANARRVFGLP